MLAPLNHITAVKILQEYHTKGSSPLKIIGGDDNLYVAKFTESRIPYLELINEVVCGGLAKEWVLKVPEMAIISIPPEVAGTFKYSSRYKPEYFNHTFFGSKLIEPVSDFNAYNKGTSKSQYQGFIDPIDILKIGCFDFWIGNKDRKPDNPNIIVSSDSSTGKLQFIPIDHTAAFAYQNHIDVSDVLIHIDKNIMECGFVKSVSRYEEKKELENLGKNIEICISAALDNIDNIFNLVPREWGFSKRAKAHLKSFLSDKERNKRISNKYLNYLKK